MRREDHDGPHQRLGQEVDRPGRTERGDQRRGEEDRCGAEAGSRQREAAEVADEHAGERQHVDEGDHRAATGRGCTPLDERVQRHEDETTRHAEGGHRRQGSGDPWAQRTEQRGDRGQPEGAQRDQPGLHLARRQAAREQGASTDADREERVRNRSHAVGQAELVARVDEDVLTEQARDPPEERHSERREVQRAVATHRGEGRGQRPPQRLGLPAGRDLRDAERREESDRRERGQRRTRDPHRSAVLEQESAGDGAEDDRDEARCLQAAVGTRQLVVRQELREQPVLAGREQCALQPHAGEHRVGRPSGRVDGQRHGARGHQQQLRDLGPDDQRPLRHPVAEEHRRHRTEHQRQRHHDERGRRDDLLLGLGTLVRSGEPEQHDEHLERVVVERAEELGGEERQQAARLVGSIHGGFPCRGSPELRPSKRLARNNQRWCVMK